MGNLQLIERCHGRKYSGKRKCVAELSEFMVGEAEKSFIEVFFAQAAMRLLHCSASPHGPRGRIPPPQRARAFPRILRLHRFLPAGALGRGRHPAYSAERSVCQGRRPHSSRCITGPREPTSLHRASRTWTVGAPFILGLDFRVCGAGRSQCRY